VSASAFGYKSWSKRFQVAPAADHETLEIPPLDVSPIAPVPEAAVRGGRPESAPQLAAGPERAQDTGSSVRVIGLATGAVGIAAVGVGTYFGVRALTLKHRSDNDCDSSGCRTNAGVSDFAEAKTSARVADIAIATGLVAMGVGAYLVLRPAPKEGPAQTLHVSIGATPAGGFATAGADF
jgi:hypothetical protein